MTTSAGSVTHWLSQLKAGDPAAAQKLWERYFRRLVGLARKKLQESPRRAADEEDVALSAFATFCRRAEAGQFSQLSDRDSLWRLLAVITARKAIRLVGEERSQKRGGAIRVTKGRAADPDFVPTGLGGAAGVVGLEDLISREPTPDFAAQVAEEFQRLLGMLGDHDLRSLALWKMEGYSNDEIATKLRCVPRTVERRLRLIRRLWEKEFTPQETDS